VVALLVLDPDACAARGAGAAELAEDPAVLAELSAALQEANRHLARVEQIKRFRVLPTDWPPGGDELTPTMKLKRRPIAAKYAAEIDALYTTN
jgi:long-subunit acyl-CoA synthetase (AMP-forming)